MLGRLPLIGGFFKGEEDAPSIAGERERAEGEFGVDQADFLAKQQAFTAEIGSLFEGYDKKVAARDAAIAAIQGTPGLGMTFQGGEVARIKREANVELSQMSANIKTRMAIREMQAGDFDRANSFVNQAVKDYTADLRMEYDLFTEFKEQNKEILDDLDDKYTQAVDDAQKAKLEELTIKEEEMTEKLKYVTDAAKAGAERVAPIEAEGAKKTDAGRIASAQSYMNARKGSDGKISWETYVEASQKWIAQGGTPSDFKFAFPPETLMDANNVKDLPATLKPTRSVSWVDFFNSIPTTPGEGG